MKLFKKFTALALSLLVLLPCFCFNGFAAEGDWLFIDGENINREVDTAVIYFGVETTNQNKWGYNLVLDTENKVTAIIEGGNAEGENLAVPEGGYVVSASGAKTEWLEEKVKIGDTLYYDGVTQRLFVLNNDGEFDPYFNKEFAVVGQTDGYSLADGTENGNINYCYKVIVNAEGDVIGTDKEIPEGGFAVYAYNKADRNDLIAYAPVGAHCTVGDGFLTFVYDEPMLKKSLEIAIADANAYMEKAKSEFEYIDYDAMAAVIAEATVLTEAKLDYRTAMGIIYKLDNELIALKAEKVGREFRGAFHTPDEKNAYDVRSTVISAKAAGLNSIILRISNGYGTYIPLPKDNKFAASSSYKDFDILQTYIDVCKKENISLALCIDVYYNEFAYIAEKDWCSETSVKGNGLEKKYFSPANADFKAYFLDYVKYIVENYDIDYLMFDHLRYPKFSESTDLGYDFSTFERFNYETEIPISDINKIRNELTSSPHWDAWVEYRKGLIDGMAKDLSDTVRSIDGDISISVVSERDVVVSHYYMQDVLGWVSQKLFDSVCVAMYENDPDELDPLGDNAYYGGIVKDKGEIIAAGTGEGTQLLMGLESSAQIGGKQIANAIEECRELGTDGFVFSNLTDFINQGYAKYLSNGILSDTVSSDIDYSYDAFRKLLEFSKIKIHDLVLKNGGCDDETYANAVKLIDGAIAKISEEVDYEYAKALESEMAVLFAASPAKAAVLKEYKALSKAALLYKAEEEQEQPDVSDPEQDESGNESEPESSMPEADTDVSDAESSAGEESEPENGNDNGNGKFSINFGDILIYGIVIATAGAFVAAVVVSIIRKRTVPKGHHMPKGSQKGYGEEKDK